MATTAIAVLQPAWDCRWSRPGHRIEGVTEALQPESRWVCVREGHRRNVNEGECETCAYWEMTAGDAAAVPVAAAAAPVVSARALEVALRTVLAVAAAVFGVGGFLALTGPAMLPVTVTLWLGMAVMAGLAAFGRFGDHDTFVIRSIH